MSDRRSAVGQLRFRAVDVLILGAIALICFLAILFHHRVAGWRALVLKNLAVAAAYVVLNSLSERIARRSWSFFLRMVDIMLALGYINLAVDKLQLIIYGRWLDDIVLRAESSLFGVPPTLWLQRFISKTLTEWLMFAYVSYLPMFFILCGVVYARRGERAAEVCFFMLSLSNVVCDLSFMLFPAAGPISSLGSQFTVPLDGFVWTWLAEGLRQHVQFVGGTIPSPHCANATLMWLLAYRYHRPSFWVLSPIVLSLYVSTVYCRFHYVTDSVLGVLVALPLFVMAPGVMNWLNRLMPTGGPEGKYLEQSTQPHS